MSWLVPITIKNSPLHGRGVFADENIAKGTVIWTWDDSMHAHTKDQLLALDSQTLHHALHGGCLHLPTQTLVWYNDGMECMNHAPGDLANIITPSWGDVAADSVVATRDISAGEELLEDYGHWVRIGMNKSHWLIELYREFCPEHADFMISILNTPQG